MNFKKNILSLAMTISLAASTAIASTITPIQCYQVFETCQSAAHTQYLICAKDAGSQYTGPCSTNLIAADNGCYVSLNACLMSNNCLDSCDSDSMCVNLVNSDSKTSNYECVPKKGSSAPAILSNKNNTSATLNTKSRTILGLK